MPRTNPARRTFSLTTLGHPMAISSSQSSKTDSEDCSGQAGFAFSTLDAFDPTPLTSYGRRRFSRFYCMLTLYSSRLREEKQNPQKWQRHARCLLLTVPGNSIKVLNVVLRLECGAEEVARRHINRVSSSGFHPSEAWLWLSPCIRSSCWGSLHRILLLGEGGDFGWTNRGRESTEPSPSGYSLFQAAKSLS